MQDGGLGGVLSSLSARTRLLIAAAAVTLVILIALPTHPSTRDWVQIQLSSGQPEPEVVLTRHAPAQRAPVPLTPTYQILNGTEVVWQIPPTPRGIVLAFHGCNHGAIDWWPKSDACKYCIGLPEEVNITREVLARGYAVLAVSSVDREESRCWMSSSPVLLGEWDSPDVQAVRVVLETWVLFHNLAHLPVYALGVSSGGDFALHLAMGNGVRLAGVCSQIMGAPTDSLVTYLQAVQGQRGKRVAPADRLTPFPPTLFVHMPRDTFTARSVSENMAALAQAGVPVGEIRVLPTPLTQARLHTAAPDEITQAQSTAIFNALKVGKLLAADGQLVDNPRSSGWRDVLKAAQVPGLDSMRLNPDESPVSEVLNVLYAGHEIVSAPTTDTIDWWESQPYPVPGSSP